MQGGRVQPLGRQKESDGQDERHDVFKWLKDTFDLAKCPIYWQRTKLFRVLQVSLPTRCQGGPAKKGEDEQRTFKLGFTIEKTRYASL